MHIYFKIILAFGNYMNGTRKKVAAGFKLESLYKVGTENAWLLSSLLTLPELC